MGIANRISRLEQQAQARLREANDSQTDLLAMLGCPDALRAPMEAEPLAHRAIAKALLDVGHVDWARLDDMMELEKARVDEAQALLQRFSGG